MELLRLFLARRDAIVDGIAGLLNAQRKPVEYLRDAALLFRHFEDGFYTATGVTLEHARLRGQLEQAHWAGGFQPRDIPGLHNGLVDPAEMMVRAFHLWQQTRWPGRNARIRYAHTLFNLYVLRSLELLSMRVWDAEPDEAHGRLLQVQAVLDELWTTSPADQPALVRDARWLIQMAQSPATDDLGAYFEIAALVADTLPESDRIEIHKAGVRMAGGHLRSQIRYHSTKAGAAPDDDGLVASTRTSNALDFALLVQELVPLLDAYERACERNDRENRLALADAICQGISPDPELFLTRLDLLGAYSMIEYLFVATDDEGRPAYTPLGRRHVGLLQEYEARVRRTARALFDDCHHFRPAAGAYSPYGVLYGFSTDLVEHMAFKTLQPDAATHFGLEDVFTAGGADKRGWVIGWRQLPHLPRDVQKQFDYPQPFAEAMFERIAQALRTRAAAGETGPAARTGRLLIEVAGDRAPDSAAMPVADLPVRYIASSDAQLVSADKALACDEPRLASDRREGRSLVSYRTAGGWVAIRKALLTEVLGAGRDVRIGGLPPAAAHVLKLMAPNLVILPEELPHFSPGS